MADFSPADWIELAKVTFAGLGTMLGGVAAIYAVVGAKRAGRAEAASLVNRGALSDVRTNVELIERNTNSISARNEAIAKALGVLEGIAKGRQQGADEAAKLLEGQKQGAEQERASVAASNPPTLAPVPSPLSKKVQGD